MSRPFNDTTNLNGLVQKYELEIGAQLGDISGSTEKLKLFASETRSAWDTYLHLAFKSAGGFQFDDTNHTKQPFVEYDLVSGQRDYVYLADEQGNLIIDLFKVMVKNRDGVYEEVLPRDQQRQGVGQDIWDGSDVTGTSRYYDKTGNSIIFDVIPDYSWTTAGESEQGIKIFVNREASYFAFDDTTKRAGVPPLHDDYFFLKPAFEYARRNSMSNYNTLRDAVMAYEGDEDQRIVGMIERHFSRRARDERSIMRPKKINYI
jgi:hypothetical protein